MDTANELPADDIQHENKTITTVLCVDDEQSILTSLKRALRKEPYQLLIANSGQEALDVMGNHKVDLVVSDMRMPGMTGAELLSQVYAEYPETMRVLLTGYSDMESTVSAINNAQIHRYITKPWNNDDLIISINSVLAYKKLQDEHKALTELAHRQNIELKDLNENLESKVKARTQDMARAAALLRKTYSQLKESYNHSIAVFSHLVELREGQSSLHGQNVANLSFAIGEALELEEEDLTDLYNAALLHDIGKLGFSDELRATPYNSLNDEQRELYEAHSNIGQSALLSIPELDKTGKIIRSHHELYNGKGFPNQLKGDSIPIGARILTVASDYDDLMNGIFMGDQFTLTQAVAYIKKQSGSRYDPAIVGKFIDIVESDSFETSSLKELKINYRELEPGMVLTQNITSEKGMLLLREGQVLDDSLIERIAVFLEDTNSSKVVYVSGTLEAEKEA